jgi:hypothetical protein
MLTPVARLARHYPPRACQPGGHRVYSVSSRSQNYDPPKSTPGTVSHWHRSRTTKQQLEAILVRSGLLVLHRTPLCTMEQRWIPDDPGRG